jgi:phage-related protein
MQWKISYYDSALQKAILNLPSGLVGRYLHCTDRMQIYGPDLGMPHTRAMGSALFELRLKSKEGISRVFFCTIVGHEILMLHQFIKKTEKTPLKELTIAQNRMKEWKNVKS